MVACLVLPRSPAAVSGKHKAATRGTPRLSITFSAAVYGRLQLTLGCSDGDVTKRRAGFTWCFTHLVVSMICKGCIQLQV